jgi:hypothetical protein
VLLYAALTIQTFWLWACAMIAAGTTVTIACTYTKYEMEHFISAQIVLKNEKPEEQR